MKTKIQKSNGQGSTAHSSAAGRAIKPPSYGIDMVDSQKQTPIQRNRTGLPDELKSGIENLSGYAMDDVKVHYNSDRPAQLQAHAFAQGTDIHVAPGQEQHLPHEAWHVVQQKQGRVRPTMQMKGRVNVNDDSGLEREADVMGSKAKKWDPLQTKTAQLVVTPERKALPGDTIQAVIATDYRHMSSTGKKPRFGEAFAFKHILNQEDSNTDWLKETKPFKKNGSRDESNITNMGNAYAQAMNRFNTSGVSVKFDTVLESTVDPPRPRYPAKNEKYYPFDVQRAWQFERIDNNNAAPNLTKFEAVVTKRISTARVAKLSAMNENGVVDHWDQEANPLF